MSKKNKILIYLCLWLIANVAYIVYFKVQVKAEEKAKAEANNAQASAKAKEQSIKDKLLSTFQWADIPAGTFSMGSPENEKNRGKNETMHQVTLSAFKMGKYEVTFEQYDFFCVATGREKPGDEGWGRGNHPVINVSWEDANAFAKWVGCRLPTEAEWEYSASFGPATKKTKWSGTNDEKNLGKYAWYGANSESKTHPVGTKQPNSLGLYDMTGNVWEWCNDWYGADYYANSPQNNPQGPSTGSSRVLRGGSWNDFDHYSFRTANRLNLPGGHNDYYGFRCAKAL